jgi:hypothetical protein
MNNQYDPGNFGKVPHNRWNPHRIKFIEQIYDKESQ